MNVPLRDTSFPQQPSPLITFHCERGGGRGVGVEEKKKTRVEGGRAEVVLVDAFRDVEKREVLFNL